MTDKLVEEVLNKLAAEHDKIFRKKGIKSNVPTIKIMRGVHTKAVRYGIEAGSKREREIWMKRHNDEQLIKAEQFMKIEKESEDRGYQQALKDISEVFSNDRVAVVIRNLDVKKKALKAGE